MNLEFRYRYLYLCLETSHTKEKNIVNKKEKERRERDRLWKRVATWVGTRKYPLSFFKQLYSRIRYTACLSPHVRFTTHLIVLHYIIYNLTKALNDSCFNYLLLIKWKRDPHICRGINLLEAFSDENNRINQPHSLSTSTKISQPRTYRWKHLSV